MKKEKIYYYRCKRCGKIIWFNKKPKFEKNYTCQSIMFSRMNGLCEGEYESITKEEYINETKK
jgi:ABC-type ATPase with predicted acetyltransferase domain